MARARPAPGAARRRPERRLRATAIRAFRGDPAEVHRRHPCTPRRLSLPKRVGPGARYRVLLRLLPRNKELGFDGYPHQDIISGAGHDAVYMARVAPAA